MTSAEHVPCAPFRELMRLKFAQPDDLKRVVQCGVREDDEALVHHATGGPYFLSFRGGDDKSDYAGREDLKYWKSDDYEAALQKCREDDARRALDFFSDIKDGGAWLDFGTGLGGVVHEYLALWRKRKRDAEQKEGENKYGGNGLQNHGANGVKENGNNSVYCAQSQHRIGVVEVQKGAVEALQRHLAPKGVEVYSSLADIVDNDAGFGVVTLFHVMEHLDDPIQMLKDIKGKMTAGGRIIVEVPHAGDALISERHYNCDAFKRFTFWKEHLVLHTKASLKAFLKDAGFKVEKVVGYQRYPLANHVGWMSEGKPGGHVRRERLRDQKTETAYAQFLDSIDATDTIIATATVP